MPASDAARHVLIPGPDHPITLSEGPRHVVVTAGGEVVADTRAAITLREASYPAVHYIPRADVDMSALERSDHHSYCPYKGEASYFSIPGIANGENAVWSYEQPHEAVAPIRDHLASYPDRVTIAVTDSQGAGQIPGEE